MVRKMNLRLNCGMQSAMPFDAILFDKDGTLVDFDRTWGAAAHEVMQTLTAGDTGAFQRLADVSGFNVREKSFRPHSPCLSGSLTDYGPLWAEVLGRHDLHQLYEEISGLFRATAIKTLTPIGDPPKLFAELGGMGLKLGIVSNDSEKSVRLQAGLLGIAEDLDYLAGQDSGYGAKPAPGMITAFAASFNIAPHRIAVVGDTLADIRAARAAGAVSIGVLTGPALAQDLAVEADHILDCAHDVPAFIRGQQAQRSSVLL
jgi:phosphoglycolate phosphatase